MPYCTQCGTQVRQSDSYCGSCGEGQQNVGTGGGPFANISPRNAAMACYIPIVGWIPAIAVLASQRFRDDRKTRFHAFQGLYLFVAYLVIQWSFIPFLGFSAHQWAGATIGKILKLALFVLGVFMIVKTSQKEDPHLPIVGDLAERSLSEQR